MKRNTISLIAFLVFLIAGGKAQPFFVHDPVMIRQDSVYYLFCTGPGISFFSSKDMKEWKREKPVFSAGPQWAIDEIPGFKGHIWAPDISFYRGKYQLFYSVSAFGKNTSCIGLAENMTLNPADPGYHWVDRGKIIESVPGRDDWNAIDPNLILDNEKKPWLCFGSFWSGIKLVKLNDELSGPAHPDRWVSLASRTRDPNIPPTEAGTGAIEAPFMVKHNGFYYLFVSFDYCCRGIQSDYKVMVGRSRQIEGPYADKLGVPMMSGGGSVVVQGDKDYPGVGHNAVCTFNGQDYIIYHAYDAHDSGKPKLIIRKLNWDAEGWPLVGKDLK